MSRETVKVSIIMPVYNVEQYLEESLNSVLDQTLRDYELICVDDGSTDKSSEILKSYQKKFKRMLIVNQDNKGAGYARNHGLEYASGEYVYFMDSDDTCKKNLLKDAVHKAEEEDADIVCFHFNRITSDGEIKKLYGFHWAWLPEGITVFNYKNCPTRILSIVNPTPWNKLYRRQFIIDNNLKFEEISSTNDITFAAVSCAKAQRIAWLYEYLYNYRVGHGNTITSKKTKNLNNIVIALESTIKQVRELEYYDEIRVALAIFIADNVIYSFEHYIQDFTLPVVCDFYKKAHELFSSDLYEDDIIESWYQELQDKYRIIRRYDYEELKAEFNREIIVSMTSYPKRINYVHKSLQSILDQTWKPDKVILWLASEQFAGKEADLPGELLRMVEDGSVTIRWCKDLKAHKKYFYALQEFSDSLIITVDDDLLIEPKMIQKLMTSYLLHPEAVSTVRCHLMTMDDDAGILPYGQWIKDFDTVVGKPSMQLFCTGGAGALYPAWLFRNLQFDESLIVEMCLYADDIWLKTMEVIAGIPVVMTSKYTGIVSIDGTQDEKLYDINIEKNDTQLQKCIEWVDSQYGDQYFYNRLMDRSLGYNLLRMDVICPYYLKRINHLQERLFNIQNTKAYKIGRPLTLYGRKCKEIIKRMVGLLKKAKNIWRNNR